MSSDQRRDEKKSEPRSRDSSQQRTAVPSGGVQLRDPDGEFEGPTRPRAGTLADSEAPFEVRVSVTGAPRAPQDSFHPVRVAVRSSRPQLSLWTRAWATTALVIVVAGGAVGIVASLRARALISGMRNADDPSHGGVAAQLGPERGATVTEVGAKGMPAAAAGYTAHPPALPGQTAPRNGASATPVVELPPGSSASSTALRPAPSGVAYRTLDSLAVSPPPPTAMAPAPTRRPKPAEAGPRWMTTRGMRDETKEPTKTPPATSDTPETKGESEAWVTEERRF
jgi:hypothetical protein